MVPLVPHSGCALGVFRVTHDILVTNSLKAALLPRLNCSAAGGQANARVFTAEVSGQIFSSGSALALSLSVVSSPELDSAETSELDSAESDSAESSELFDSAESSELESSERGDRLRRHLSNLNFGAANGVKSNAKPLISFILWGEGGNISFLGSLCLNRSNKKLQKLQSSQDGTKTHTAAKTRWNPLEMGYHLGCSVGCCSTFSHAVPGMPDDCGGKHGQKQCIWLAHALGAQAPVP